MKTLALIREVNQLFEPFYPHVARQIAEAYCRQEGSALEIGPYAPGISLCLAQLYPKLEIVVGDDTPGILSYFRDRIELSGLAGRIKVQGLTKTAMPFGESTFDLVYFRGALFFWEKQVEILQEAYRVLKGGGVGVLGGGFGASAPDWLIDCVLDRSRELNQRLGKKALSEVELRAILQKASLTPCAQIDKRHGLWVIIRKP
ncbi:methyltransferase domain-containing protein [Chloroflexota bacterium]